MKCSHRIDPDPYAVGSLMSVAIQESGGGSPIFRRLFRSARVPTNYARRIVSPAVHLVLMRPEIVKHDR
jgi:hypothetical protein